MKIDQRSPLRAEITPYQAPIDLDPSPALSLVGKAKPMLKGRKIGALVTDGADGDRLQALRDTLEGEGAEPAIVAPKIGGVRLKSGKDLAADIALSGPSLFFDALAIFASAEGVSRGTRTALRSIGFETLSGISKLSAIGQPRSLSSQGRALPMTSTKA
jgi:hypothetical protein